MVENQNQPKEYDAVLGGQIPPPVTVGMKTHDIDANLEICLQVKEIHGSRHWRSVIVNGRASRLIEH